MSENVEEIKVDLPIQREKIAINFGEEVSKYKTSYLIGGKSLDNWSRGWSQRLPENPDIIILKIALNNNAKHYDECIDIYSSMMFALNIIRKKEKRLLEEIKNELMKLPSVKTMTKAESMAKEQIKDVISARLDGEMIVEFFESQLQKIKYCGDRYSNISSMLMSEMKNIRNA